jgi:hypothetical protein
VFSLLKRRFTIIRDIPLEYSIEKQVQIVYAITGLHNFILTQLEEGALALEERESIARAAKRARQQVVGLSQEVY